MSYTISPLVETTMNRNGSKICVDFDKLLDYIIYLILKISIYQIQRDLLKVLSDNIQNDYQQRSLSIGSIPALHPQSVA